jgi:predicted Zn-dependent peptidase
LNGLTPELQSARRDRIFKVSMDQVIDVANRYLSQQNSSISVIGKKRNLPDLDNWKLTQLG